MVHGRQVDYARFRLTNVGAESFGLHAEVDGERVEPYRLGVPADLQRVDSSGVWTSQSVVFDHKLFPKLMLRLKPGESDTIVVPADGADGESGYRLLV